MTRGADALADWLLLNSQDTAATRIYISLCFFLSSAYESSRRVKSSFRYILLRGNNNFLTFLATQRYIHTSIYRVRNSTAKYWNMHSWLQGERKSPNSKPCCLEVLLFVRNCVYFVWFMFVCLFCLWTSLLLNIAVGHFCPLRQHRWCPQLRWAGRQRMTNGQKDFNVEGGRWTAAVVAVTILGEWGE